MFAANTYNIRYAKPDDNQTLTSLAERNSQQPLTGPVLIGEFNGATAALSLADGRVIVDPSPRTDHLVANLRVRAVSTWAHESTPSLRDRLLAGLPAWYRAVSVPASQSATSDVEREPALVSG
jgi:hypothetical protein